LEHKRKSARSAQIAAESLRCRADAVRLVRVRLLGFDTISDYLRQRYLVEHASLADLKTEIATGQAVLRRLMSESRIPVRPRLPAANASLRRARLLHLESDPGPEGKPWRRYFRDRIAEGWTLSAIARETHRSRGWVGSSLRLLGLASRPLSPRPRRV